MKLDRNVNGAGRGKYGLIQNRRLQHLQSDEFKSGGFACAAIAEDVRQAVRTLEAHGVIDWGVSETENEFFVIRLRDQYARPALDAYADMAAEHDPEYECEVRALAARAGFGSDFCKKPD